jgi:AraC-like DNA-binding protein
VNENLPGINPRNAGEDICGPNSIAEPFFRPYPILHYVFSGKGIFRIKDIEYPVDKGALVILYPYENMSHYADTYDPMHYCWVDFEISIKTPFFKKSDIMYIPQAEHIFADIVKANEIRQGKEFYICGKIYELLSILYQINAPLKSKTADLINRAKKYLNSNFHLPITVEQIARDLNINRSYFSTIFFNYTGRSPQQYLIDIRLEYAAELMLYKGCKVNEAAHRSGYTDAFNFSRMFKKKFGVSPTDYIMLKNEK